VKSGTIFDQWTMYGLNREVPGLYNTAFL